MIPSPASAFFSLHPPGKILERSCNANKREKERLSSVLNGISKSEDRTMRDMTKSISSLQASLDKVNLDGGFDTFSMDGFENTSKSVPTTPKQRRSLKIGQVSPLSFDDDSYHNKHELSASRSLHSITPTSSARGDDILLTQSRRRRNRHDSLPSIFGSGSISAPSSPKTGSRQHADKLSLSQQHHSNGHGIRRRASDAHKTMSQIVDSYRDLSTSHQSKAAGKSSFGHSSNHNFRRFSLGANNESVIKSSVTSHDRKGGYIKDKKKIGYDVNIDMENAVYDPKIPKMKSKFAKRM